MDFASPRKLILVRRNLKSESSTSNVALLINMGSQIGRAKSPGKPLKPNQIKHRSVDFIVIKNYPLIKMVAFLLGTP